MEEFQLKTFKRLNSIIVDCKSGKALKQQRDTIIRLIAVTAGLCELEDCQKYCPLGCRDHNKKFIRTTP